MSSRRKSPASVWRAILVLAAAAAGPSFGTGCRHHCGYIDVQVEYRQIPEETRLLGPVTELLVTHVPEAGSSVLEVQGVESATPVHRAERSFTGREVYTQYHWSVPFAKLFLPFSLVMAVMMPFEQPHCHDGGPWGAGDYLRDFVGWLNPFEAYPGGAEHFGSERVPIRREVCHERSTPVVRALAGAGVSVSQGRNLVAQGQADADGRFRLDLASPALPLDLSGKVRLDVTYRGAKSGPLSKLIEVDGRLIATRREERGRQ